MATKDYEVGYRKPPRHTRFHKGVCPNPAGRRGKKDTSEKSAFQKILSEHIPYTIKGRRKRATRLDLLIQQYIRSALTGHVKCGDSLLTMHARLFSSSSADVTIVSFGKTGLPPMGDERRIKISDR